MKFFRRPKSLFINTSITLAANHTLCIIFTISIALYFIIFPMANRAADDMAGLINEVSQSWISMSEKERSAFQSHLREHHQLFITSTPVAVTEIKNYYPFITRLEKALRFHIGQKVVIKQDFERRPCFWITVLIGDQTVRVGFLHERFGPRPFIALIGIFAIGCFLAFVTSIYLVRRITRPIKELSRATNQYGIGNFSTRIPETGPEELASLARSFNLMAQELSQLLANRAILFAGISHDLKTPITRMRIALELLEEDCNKTLIASLQRDLEEMNQLILQSIALVKGLDRHNVVAVNIMGVPLFMYTLGLIEQ
jgi:two-component system osmolarity sensor histidine kinase EnvZ